MITFSLKHSVLLRGLCLTMLILGTSVHSSRGVRRVQVTPTRKLSL
uniref:Uncharacterized protein n=1 Tax=Brassica campestris TaxID=3711 RepID=A0A3P5Z048_BRACM|nr:unnamed protein product [Brassica rapa]